MNIKPRLGLLTVGKKNQYQGEIIRFREFYQERLAKDDCIELLLEDKLFFDEHDLVQAAKAMEARGADLILICVGTWIYPSMVISAVNDLSTPFILYGLSDTIANGNLGAAVQIRYVLQEMGRKFVFLAGGIIDEENYHVIMKCLKAAWVKRYLRNRKIGLIGGKCMMMYQTQVNEFCWKSVFGVDFPQYDAVHVFNEMEKIDDKEAEIVAQDFLSRVDQVIWELDNGERIYDDAIVTQAKMFLAFKRLKELYDIDIFANKCMPEMSAHCYGYGYAACLATCMLNEAGIVTACEADVPAGLSMFILNLLTGAKVFFADIGRLNKAKNRLTFFNCGTAPISLADRKKGVSLWPIPGFISDEAVPDMYFMNHMKGACIHFDLETGRPVTMLRIGGNDNTLRFHVARAVTVEREVAPEEIIGHRWPGFGLEFRNDVSRFLNNTTGHHYSVVYGNCSDELYYLAQFLGVDFVLDE